MLLGEKHRVPAETGEAFRRAGLAHALVVSGLHVGLVAVFCLGILRLCRVPEGAAALGTLAVLGLYALVTEFQAPVVRAGLMAAAALLGRLLGRPAETYNALGLAGLVLMAARPAEPFSLGFQLSFAATLAIVRLQGMLRALLPRPWRSGRKGEWVAAPLCVSLAAQIGTAPLIAYHFQQAPLAAPLANLAAVPLLGAAVGLGLGTGLVGEWWPGLALLFNGANWLVLTALGGIAATTAALPWATVEVSRPALPWLLAWGAAVLVLPQVVERPLWRKGAVFAVLALANAGVWAHVFEERRLEIVFFDVGQGDAALVRCPNGRVLVIDAGERSPRYDYGQRVLLPYLRREGIGRVDAVIASHAHNDHIGGLLALIEAVEVGYYLDSGQAPPSSTAKRLLAAVKRRGVRYRRVKAGDRLQGLGQVEALVLHPDERFVDAEGASPWGLNNGSAVLRLQYGQVGVLFTGDIEQEAGAVLAGWGQRLQSQVLKVAHHGSRTSSGADFIAAVRPRLALVSVGAYNRFGHPAASVVERLQAAGAQVVRTDRRGALVLETDGRQMRWRTVIE